MTTRAKAKVHGLAVPRSAPAQPNNRDPQRRHLHRGILVPATESPAGRLDIASPQSLVASHKWLINFIYA
jgi:hypothetical protein